MEEKGKQDCAVSYDNVCPITKQELENSAFSNTANCEIKCEL